MEIKFKRNGGLFIDSSIHKDWVVRIPTVKHRLIRGGSVALDMPQRFDLRNGKKGIVFIDMSMKKYLVITNEILALYEPTVAAYMGVKDAFHCYSVKTILEEQNLELILIREAK